MRKVETDTVIRSLAILLVAFNHAHSHTTLRFAGGMIVLMTLSGYNIARFGLSKGDGIKASNMILSTVAKIILPSFALVIFFFIARQQFSISELLFYRNFITKERISVFPTWYPQVFWQMMVPIALMLRVPIISRKFCSAPLKWLLSLFCLFLALRVFAGDDTGRLSLHLPHFFLWSILLGFSCYFMVSRKAPSSKWIAASLVTIAALLVFGPDRLPFWTLLIGMYAMIFVRAVPLPNVVAWFFEIVAQATFTIFLLHRAFFVLYEEILFPSSSNPVLKWTFGVSCSIVAWLFIVSALRAYRKMSRATARPLSGA